MKEFYTYAWQKFHDAAKHLPNEDLEPQKRVHFAWMSLVHLDRPKNFESDTMWRQFEALAEAARAKRIDVGGHPVIDCTDEWAEAHAAKLLDIWKRLDRLCREGSW